MKKAKKVHLCARSHPNWIVFNHQDTGGIWMFWAGWNKEEPKFIQKKLVEKYWLEEGIAIYNKYNEALLEVADMEIDWIKWDVSVLTLYIPDET